MSVGRPRSFDAEAALDRALEVFWSKGYEGASLPDLTEAMGINRPSLYAAFGNKEELFRKALDRYAAGPAVHVREALEQPTARGVVEHLLYGGIDLITDPDHPKGCFYVQGALACGESADPLKRDLAKRRAAHEAAIRRRFERAVEEQDLPADAHPADLARLITVVSHGMAVQAAGGASRKDLRRVADLVLRAWPP